MPPKAKTNKKRARSPDPKPADDAEVRSSKRVKKDASASSSSTAVSASATVSAKSQVEAVGVIALPPPATPCFHGNFDLYAMSLPSLNSVFAPERDYAALLNAIRTYQAKTAVTALIFLPDSEGGLPNPKAGHFQSRAVLDPMQEWPFDLALRSLARKAALGFTAREMADNTQAEFFSASGKAAKTPGVTAAVALAHDLCGIKSSKGAFKMRRAWVSADGKDEVFEGVFSVSIVYTSLYRRKCDESSCRETFAFWGVRARNVGEDGKEIGLGPGTGRGW